MSETKHTPEELERIAAAPELLALLKRFYDATYGKTDLIPPLDFEQARAALAKAEGRG